ncbi:MAG: hypothetical protein RI964_3280 [Pseudomonadota bacterium]|jgi:hypothetical protein
MIISIALLTFAGMSSSWAADAPAKPTAAQTCPAQQADLNEADKAIARIAWQYFENNLQASTGLVNAVDNYPSTTMWDTGSTLAALIAAEKLGFIPRDRFDSLIGHMLKTLREVDKFNGEAPNKAYNTQSGAKVDYRNQPSAQGIGASTLDLARLASWLNILACLYPQHQEKARKVLESWNFCRLIEHGEMYGLTWNEQSRQVEIQQEGRLGYEQYAGKTFRLLGFDQSLSASYKNMYATTTEVSGVTLAVDARDATTLGAHNYVVSESYAMDALEHGLDAENRPLVENIYQVQQKRWEDTGQVTAVSEDNLDRKPYFVYNTIFTDGKPWNAITDKGVDMADLKSVSTKAAFSMAYLFPERPYSKVLLATVKDAHDPTKGWYSGIYEDKAKGFNQAMTANTNGVILSIFLYKLYGALQQQCKQCKQGVTLTTEFMQRNMDKQQCLNAFNPVHSTQ